VHRPLPLDVSLSLPPSFSTFWLAVFPGDILQFLKSEIGEYLKGESYNMTEMII